MAQVLLLGVTHFPRLRLPDNLWNALFLKMLSDPSVPPEARDPASWPDGLREEWSDDKVLRAAAKHRGALVADFRRVRAELDRFNPDFVLIWGDDQYENFREDGVPPFAVLAYEPQKLQPSKQSLDGSKTVAPDFWSGGSDFSMDVNFHRPAANYLTSALLNKGFDITYAYRPRHVSLGHAFANTVLYLDNDRVGFPWRIVPFSVNCYGRIVLSQRGLPVGMSNVTAEADMDPPSPAPWRCFDLGRACIQALAQSPWRVAVIASSSWSHAFFTRKNYFLYPDVESDKRLFDDLAKGNYEPWRTRSLIDIENSGQQEILNWVCLSGALSELKLVPRYANFHESYMFNSPKVFLVAGGD
jgi:hypothetical protein